MCVVYVQISLFSYFPLVEDVHCIALCVHVFIKEKKPVRYVLRLRK